MDAMPNALPQRDPSSRVDSLKSAIARELAQLRTELEHTPSTPDADTHLEGRVGHIYQAFLRHTDKAPTHGLREDAA